MWQRRYREDSVVLGELGLVLLEGPLPRIEVRLPKPLAEAALSAWEDESNEGPLDAESFEQRVQRHHAGTLGLIGLAIETSGRWDGDAMVVALGPELIGAAIDASDYLPTG